MGKLVEVTLEIDAELKAENKQLHSRLPTMKEKLKEAQERQELISENRDLRQQVAYLEDSLDLSLIHI